MSWVRFSTICSNNRSSDIYCYDDCMGGVTIMVAGRKMLNEHLAPKIPEWGEINFLNRKDKETWDKWAENYSKCEDERDKWLEENSEYEDIGLPYDGDTFNVSDKEELIALLTELRDVGYNFPDRIFDIAENYEEDE